SGAGHSVLVTGAYGLLGSWLVKALVRRGFPTAVVKRDGVADSALTIEGIEPRVGVLLGDVTDGQVMGRALNESEVDTVFHLAAHTIVGIANQTPLTTFDTNIRGTWTVLEACRRAGVQWVVVAASDKAYGVHDRLPYGEEDPLRPRYPYEVSKAA